MLNGILASVLAICATSASQPGFNPDYAYDSLDSLIWEAIVQIDAEEFDSALVLFQRVIDADTTSPKGYFFVAAAYSNLVSDYRNFSYKSQFYDHVDRAIEIGERKEKSGNATAEDLFFYGGAVGYRGIFKSFDGDWWGAFKDGLRGRSLLGKAFDADSTYIDVYLGLGSYDYWRSAKTKALWWLPFFSDKREKGITEIKRSIEGGKFASHEGRYALMRIYYDYGKYNEEVELWENEVHLFNPEDPFSNYWLGRSYIELGDFEKALESFETVLSVYLRSPYYDPGGEMESRYFIGLCQYELGNLEEAAIQLRKSKDLSENLKGRKDIEEALKDVDPLLKKVLKKLNE